MNVLLPLLAGCLAASCAGGTYVWVSQDRFVAELPQEAGDYRGKPIFMPGFENRADDTSMFYYYSPDRTVKYEGAPSIQSYLWYCFEKAFRKAGMRVYSEGGPVYAPELQLRILSWTDREMVLEVALLRETEEVFSDKFAIPGDPPQGAQPAELEAAAYRMVNAAVSEILRDRRFSEVFQAVGRGNGDDEP